MISCRDEGFAAALAYSSTNPAMVFHNPPSPISHCHCLLPNKDLV